MSVSPRPGRQQPSRRPHSLVHTTPLQQWLQQWQMPSAPSAPGAPGAPSPPSPPRPAQARNAPTASFAEQLGPWLGWADAISLAATLQAQASLAPPSSAPFPATTGRPMAATVACAQARHCAAAARLAHEVLTAMIDAHTCATPDAVQVHAAHTHPQLQRHMQTRIALVRARLRTALAACSPALRQLSELDEALERALAPRERQLLATLPGLLQQQQGAPGADMAATGAAADLAGSSSAAEPGLPADTGRPHQTLRTVLLAELHARWQPVAGLLEALDEHLATAAAQAAPTT